ncbi:hypothetical protein Htur_3959 (plasmid) [Haloterrigena turkmenica DSM 5511]|uniref:Uncharacterized protein n=1 Tax=Haloterrigena turkmenica (strain ATCC 51198 / DSM 5511 / JCM 9101 / NCIMB 13204 / VKM B-1734 / 4k) TaxID=543526 RepID=D2S0B6_HALTV|nr:hypothetical protein [Haloterrigena turkmenica]ADB62813.1 hypothetical protein Htur_3959 [Haloterrigena turkmenica DSM 5511]
MARTSEERDPNRCYCFFAGAILDLECREGEPTALERAEITICDLPINSGSTSGSEYDTAMELIDEFVDQLLTTTRSL